MLTIPADALQEMTASPFEDGGRGYE